MQGRIVVRGRQQSVSKYAVLVWILAEAKTRIYERPDSKRLSRACGDNDRGGCE
jgi:hypothetical protein